MSLFGNIKKKNKNGFLEIEVRPLIDWDEPNGEGCIVSDRITKDGWKVGYMFRETPLENQPDSGWHFYKGDESDEYSNNPDNFHVFALNTICNYDEAVIPYLHLPVGTYLIRAGGGTFIQDDGSREIVFERQ